MLTDEQFKVLMNDLHRMDQTCSSESQSYCHTWTKFGTPLTVQKLIDLLNQVEDKSKFVVQDGVAVERLVETNHLVDLKTFSY